MLCFMMFLGQTFKNIQDVRTLALGRAWVCLECFDMLHVLFDDKTFMEAHWNVYECIYGGKIQEKLPQGQTKGPWGWPNLWAKDVQSW